jgi:hypothetical protein
MKFFAEFTLNEILRSLLSLRMTGGAKGSLRMTTSGGFKMTLETLEKISLLSLLECRKP